MIDKIITIEDQISAVEISIGYYSVELIKKYWGDDQNAYNRHIERLKAAKKTLEQTQARKERL